MNNTRNRIFYLKSQIEEGLYTSGTEWVDDLGVEYIGQYHKYIDGLVMSGTTYTSSSTRLYPYKADVSLHAKLIREANKYESPYYFPPKISNLDIIRGYVIRYFLQRRNDITDIIEVNELQYKLWRRIGSGIDEKLYNGVELKWKIVGQKYSSLETEIKTEGIYDINKSSVHEANKIILNLENYITDYLEFFQES